jgi:hypothetical protein
MTDSPRTALALLLCLTLLAGCGESRPNNPAPDSPDYAGEPGSQLGQFGSLTGGDSLLSFGTSKKPSADNGTGTGLGVNAYLWRGALDTLSFMPLASADPFGGVIVTDWYSPPAANGERFKATAYIMGRELRTDAIRVAIFRQVLQNGQWVDAPVSPVTVGEIEDKVLARARELRTQSASNS